jgi:hypothetical protein
MERRWSDRAFWVGPNEAAPVWPRVVLAMFGLVLVAQAVWILLPELQRPQRLRIIDEKAGAEAALGQARDAGRAARFAVVRGDLWARSAFVHSDLLATQQTPGPGSTAADETRTDLERAVRYSPHRGDAWLLLATMADRYGWQGYEPAALLKMSYYTAPNDEALFLLRIKVALHVAALEDVELADMVGRDVRLLITKMPALKPAFLGVYKAAPGRGRRFVEQVVSEIDPAYLADLRRAPQ